MSLIKTRACIPSKQKHIVIVGAGFAGLKLARELNNNMHYCITLIDKNNYHQFQPLLYQEAMASLDASNISFPLRKVFIFSRGEATRKTTEQIAVVFGRSEATRETAYQTF